VIEQGRRPGDPMSVTACSERIRRVLGWEPRFDDLDTVIATTLAWERRRSSVAGAPRVSASAVLPAGKGVPAA
jgi:UDP-glucose 4-epimerase